MKPSDFQKTIQCQFDCKLKRVVKGIVRNYRKELKRRRNKEISYCELPEIYHGYLQPGSVQAYRPEHPR